jgi:hypothetical protein
VFENRMLRRIFRPKRDEETGKVKGKVIPVKGRGGP